MERLTIEKAGSILVKDLSGGYTSPCFGCESIGNCVSKKIQPCAIYRALEKLKEYEDLEEQGKLLKLPCAAGDTVYRFYTVDDETKIYEHCITTLTNIVNIMESGEMGKIAFLTKSAAEAALQKLKETEG